MVCRTMSGSVSAAGLATSADNSTEEILGADFCSHFRGKSLPQAHSEAQLRNSAFASSSLEEDMFFETHEFISSKKRFTCGVLF